MAEPTPQTTPTPLRIGVFYEKTQMTDLAGLDILGNISTEIVTMVTTLLPAYAPLLPFSHPTTFLYIASTLSPTWCTPSMNIVPTHTYATAPTDLDILLLGGPDPMNVPEESLEYLRKAAKETKTILTTCTGGMWLARSGVLDGKKATTNRMLVESARGAFPKVEWVEQRWVVEKGEFEGAEIWTAGGAGCGIDMTAEYAFRNFDRGLVLSALVGLDFDVKGRGQFYTEPIPEIPGLK
ncbi:class I glutamine amidotransferase-like protein [Amniculicola lignicola CBS 123094]|uniref:Class I glutamine amidotransferase-like protein n=1 Tax=Amniculicola lignicola CBS 123094 TaxID=1392246 RepID=A0A6A5WKG4_9PLEO|nr:class I glutamine amidotransferase-like protein [Amniculicola lignicola CBS 123094]